MGRLVIEEDTVYEVDEDCLCKREEQESLADGENPQEPLDGNRALREDRK